MNTTTEAKDSQRPGAFHDVVAHHQRRPVPSEVLADRHGDAVWAALRVAEARKAIETWNRLADRDRASGRTPSSILMDRINRARVALAHAENDFAVVRGLPPTASCFVVKAIVPAAPIVPTLQQRQVDFLAANPSAAVLLDVIRANPTGQQKDWCAVIGKSAPVVSTVFQKLEAVGLVTRDETCVGGSAVYVPRRKVGRPRSKG